MSQDEVLKVLNKLKENEWINTGELIEILDFERSSILSNLRGLRNSGEVVSRWTNYPWVGNSRQYEHRSTKKECTL